MIGHPLKLPSETTHRYVPLPIAMDYVQAGWLPLPSLLGCSHGEWAVHMIWICQCPAPLPDRVTRRTDYDARSCIQ